MSRREKIEAMLAEDPGDIFLRYSLAMELDKQGEHDASLARFAELTRDDPQFANTLGIIHQVRGEGRLAEMLVHWASDQTSLPSEKAKLREVSLVADATGKLAKLIESAAAR